MPEGRRRVVGDRGLQHRARRLRLPLARLELGARRVERPVGRVGRDAELEELAGAIWAAELRFEKGVGDVGGRVWLDLE